MFGVDETLIIKEVPKEKRYNLKYEISKAIHSGLFFAMQKHGRLYVAQLLL